MSAASPPGADVRVCVVGLGKIGLPLAVQYASRGLEVTGYDIDRMRVDDVNAGRNPLPWEAELDERLPAAVRDGCLSATADAAEAAANAEVAVFIVPIGLTVGNQPDFSHLDAAAAAICPALPPNTLVILETTAPVGTTRGRLGAALESAGRKLAVDCFLAFSPERVSSGHILRDLRSYPKLVGAIDDASWQRAEAFYRAALQAPYVVRLSSPETAEFAKIAEGVYRDANIAIASELARYADAVGVDATEAFAAANSQPYSHLHAPGVGVGGHCLPVYPRFLVGHDTPLIQHARQVNDAMAAYAAERLSKVMGVLDGKTVLVLGLAYRPNVREAAHSSAILLSRALRDRGARALVHDPFFSDEEVRALGLDPPPLFPPERLDAIIVQAWHDAYRDLDLRAFAANGCRALLDGRNALDRARVEAAGLTYLGIGR
jgi:UDP-N-acetyl-D-mannosaminuronic acid dehydrogenase